MRTKTNLTHHITTCSEIGRLQTLVCLPVLAGDSIGISLGGEITMSPLRRRIVMDANATFAAFYIPNRHIWGEDWVNFIKQGVDETVDLGTITGNAEEQYECYAFRPRGTAMMKAIPAGYNQIWNRYWRLPMHQMEKADGLLPTGDDALYGWPVAQLPSVISSAAKVSFDEADHKANVQANKIDIIDLDKTKARYSTEIMREWFTIRYNDLMAKKWGSGVNIDADERPQLIWTQRNNFGGYDLTGSDDAGLGQEEGRSAMPLNFKMPKRYFKEHGWVWVMMAIRYELVHHDEAHYFSRVVNPSYKEFAGDGTIMAAEPYRNQTPQDYMNDNDTTPIGQEPYGLWWHFHPNYIHRNFESAFGYPYLDDLATVRNTAMARLVCQPELYEDIFSNTQYGHYQVLGKAFINANRAIPVPMSSIYAGV